jgi:hypothetical protein
MCGKKITVIMKASSLIAVMLFLFLFTALLSCSHKHTAGGRGNFKCRIQAIELSEDLSPLSTKRDETMLLVYEVNDSLTPVKLVQIQSFMPVGNEVMTTGLNYNPSGKQLMAVLIEMDTDKSENALEAEVSTQLKKLYDIYTSRDLLKRRDALGDDDLLGMYLVKNMKPGRRTKIIFEGVHIMDRYKYRLDLEWNYVHVR